ncbi:DUF2391 family protein [Haloarchaeobius sp. DYHT-AS-18]|uniref:DUF2391 family protein n=1 Tax=Haloarchaeobius sp. DYHT-AS-18 TaxID=3446117 RepID=UPI003EBCF934
MSRSDTRPESVTPSTTEPAIDELLSKLERLEGSLENPEEREQLREAMVLAALVSQQGVFGRVVDGFDRSDLAEALLGALVFGIPMFVEGGTLEIGAFLASQPAFLAGTYVVTVGVVISILYVADFQDVRIRNPILGVVPRRLAGVIGVSLVTALVVMTAWGRVDWATPLLAFAQTTVAFAPMTIGAALGDILPGS